jgi:pimeloyl-ACP methyl ester carboxylesterase
MINRRSFLSIASAIGLQSIFRRSAAAAPRAPVLRIMFVHGRDQQGINPVKLKDQWMEALHLGAKALGRQVPDSLDVSFPYYGDILDTYTHGIPTTDEVQARGDDQADLNFLAFEAAAVDELRKGAGISDQKVDDLYGSDPQSRRPENWRWVQAIVRAIDKYGFGMSGATVEVLMRDVYLYTSQGGVRDKIDSIVNTLLTEEPTIIVAHSLGSVVAYRVLRNDTRKLQVPLFVTVGSPLGIRAIRDQLVPIGFPKPVAAWNNALDTRDIVALYPLDAGNFPVNPAVTNYNQVKNHTDNRHGIVGYLDDPTVAGWVLDALG